MSFFKIKLYDIRNWVRGLSPLYISICAALLLDLRSNIKCEWSFFWYFGGVIFFITANIISNELSNRCNSYGRIYDIKINVSLENDTRITRELIYEKRENKLKSKKRLFEYYGVFVFGIFGLVFIIISYSSLNNQIQRFDDQNKILKYQIDSLKTINIGYENQISDLNKANDSIKNVHQDKYILKLNYPKLPNCRQNKVDSIHNKH